MEFKEIKKKLEEKRNENKKRFEESKPLIKEAINNAQHTILLATDSSLSIVGNSMDVRTTLACLFDGLIERKMLTKEEIQEILSCVDSEEDTKKMDNFINKLKEFQKELQDIMKKI